MNSRQENRSKLSFTARIITKYSLERFLSICGEKMSKGFLKFCKLISNLILGQIIVSNLTNVHNLNTRMNYAPEKYQVRPVLLQTLQPSLYASRKVKMKMMPSEIGFPTLTLATYFSTKIPINKLAVHNSLEDSC